MPLEELPQSLLSEGRAMLLALCQDACRFAKVTVTVDSRLGLQQDLQGIECFDAGSGQDDFIDLWLRESKAADRSIVIAPECDGILSGIAERIRDHSQHLVAPDHKFLTATSDKLQFSEYMRSSGVPHPATANSTQELPAAESYVTKPIDGCGSEGIRFCNSLSEAADCLAGGSCGLVQTYHPGMAASITAVASERETIWLPAVRQLLKSKTFTYLGGSGPLPPEFQDRCQRLGEASLSALPGKPLGYIGVDVVLGDDPSDDVVIEVNPRITTSFVGLRRILQTNIAALMLGVSSEPIERIDGDWQVRWNANGKVEVIDGQSLDRN